MSAALAVGLWYKWQRHFLVFGTIDARTRGRAGGFYYCILERFSGSCLEYSMWP